MWTGRIITSGPAPLFRNRGSVDIYQLSKIIITPVTIALQAALYRRSFSRAVLLSSLVICTGVGYANVSNPAITLSGALVAALAVAATAYTGIFVGERMKAWPPEQKVSDLQMMLAEAPYSPALMLIALPMSDNISGIVAYPYSIELCGWVLLTGLLAAMVNLTSFMVVSKLSPLTYLVCGHLKTVLILSLGVVFLGRRVGGARLARQTPLSRRLLHSPTAATLTPLSVINPKMQIGLCVTAVGILLYSRAKVRRSERQRLTG